MRREGESLCDTAKSSTHQNLSPTTPLARFCLHVDVRRAGLIRERSKLDANRENRHHIKKAIPSVSKHIHILLKQTNVIAILLERSQSDIFTSQTKDEGVNINLEASFSFSTTTTSDDNKNPHHHFHLYYSHKFKIINIFTSIINITNKVISTHSGYNKRKNDRQKARLPRASSFQVQLSANLSTVRRGDGSVATSTIRRPREGRLLQEGISGHDGTRTHHFVPSSLDGRQRFSTNQQGLSSGNVILPWSLQGWSSIPPLGR